MQKPYRGCCPSTLITRPIAGREPGHVTAGKKRSANIPKEIDILLTTISHNKLHTDFNTNSQTCQIFHADLYPPPANVPHPLYMLGFIVYMSLYFFYIFDAGLYSRIFLLYFINKVGQRDPIFFILYIFFISNFLQNTKSFHLLNL